MKRPRINPLPPLPTKALAPDLQYIRGIGIDAFEFFIPNDATYRANAEEIVQNFDDYGASSLSAYSGPMSRRLRVKVAGKNLFADAAPKMPYFPRGVVFKFNPNRFSDAELQEVFTVIRRLLGINWASLLQGARVTRLDLNLDVALDLCGVLIRAPYVRSGVNVLRIVDGKAKPGSIYFGGNNSRQRLRLYDKKLEVLCRTLGPCSEMIWAAIESASRAWPMKLSDIREFAEGEPLWRVEVVFKLKGGLLYSQIEDEIADCFSDYTLLVLPVDVPPFNDSMGRLFVQLASYAGLHVALQLLEPNEARRFKAAIAAKPPLEWWTPELYTQHVAKALRRLDPLLKSPGVTYRTIPNRTRDPSSAANDTTSQPAHRRRLG